ncbi:hypothetical protein M8818_006884 [Zalaria obscura]|uniref:Uncharacterized protein n=1 Tax=Zalaria obscura TaxID=2024903 RepID=A0ACC3S718_9PEZI
MTGLHREEDKNLKYVADQQSTSSGSGGWEEGAIEFANGRAGRAINRREEIQKRRDQPCTSYQLQGM